jgi:hypothetical protein
MGELFYGLVLFVCAGFLYFRIVVPIRESVKPSAPPPPALSPELTSSGREQQHAPVVSDTGIKAVSVPPLRADATEREIVRWLAGLKTADTWRYSANAIYALVKGNRNDVLAWVREARGYEDDEPTLVQLPGDPSVRVPPYQPPPQPSTK